jgi:hypothetical protein
MTNIKGDEAAVAALARAIRRAWPARTIERFAAGWSSLFLLALRADPEGRAAVVAALLDEATLARALGTAGVFEGSGEDIHGLARDILAALAGSTEGPG